MLLPQRHEEKTEKMVSGDIASFIETYPGRTLTELLYITQQNGEAIPQRRMRRYLFEARRQKLIFLGTGNRWFPRLPGVPLRRNERPLKPHLRPKLDEDDTRLCPRGYRQHLPDINTTSFFPAVGELKHQPKQLYPQRSSSNPNHERSLLSPLSPHAQNSSSSSPRTSLSVIRDMKLRTREMESKAEIDVTQQPQAMQEKDSSDESDSSSFKYDGPISDEDSSFPPSPKAARHSRSASPSSKNSQSSSDDVGYPRSSKAKSVKSHGVCLQCQYCVQLLEHTMYLLKRAQRAVERAQKHMPRHIDMSRHHRKAALYSEAPPIPHERLRRERTQK